MRNLIWTSFLVALLVTIGPDVMAQRALAEAMDNTATFRVLYRKDLPGGKALIISKGPMVLGSAMKDLISPALLTRSTDPVVGFTSLSVELQLSPKSSLRLWSQMRSLYAESDYEKYAVLCLLPATDQVVFVLKGPGTSLSLFRLELDGSSNDETGPAHYEWSQIEAVDYDPPGRLAAQLTCDEKTKRITVDITDTLEGTRQHSIFEQKGEAWELTRIKQWNEKISGVRN